MYIYIHIYIHIHIYIYIYVCHYQAENHPVPKPRLAHLQRNPANLRFALTLRRLQDRIVSKPRAVFGVHQHPLLLKQGSVLGSNGTHGSVAQESEGSPLKGDTPWSQPGVYSSGVNIKTEVSARIVRRIRPLDTCVTGGWGRQTMGTSKHSRATEGPLRHIPNGWPIRTGQLGSIKS